MRVHRLEVTAFGPFADTQRIDFDALNDVGLFLLTGQTGAGKTSVLDAICFGLFGAVPGARNNAKDLKSHHAGPEAQPVIELEVSLRGRRFTLRRSPAWVRASRRAKSGHVDQAAKATVSELVAGQWVPLTSRLDEVGHLVTRLLGMNRDQFCQVVLLPQGQFQTFLRAGAKQRHDVLESLFESGRFLRIEQWLAEHRRSCDNACQAQETRISRLLAHIDEAHGSPLTATAEVCAASAGSSFADSRQALETVLEATTASVAQTRVHEAASLDRVKAAEHALDEAQTLRDRQQSYAEALRQLAELDATADLVRDREREVNRARAAEGLQPLLELCDEAEQSWQRSRDETLELFVRSGWPDARPLDALPVCDVTALSVALRAELSTAQALSSVEAEVELSLQEIASLREGVSHQDAEITAMAAELAAAPEAIGEARAELARVTHSAAELGQLRAHVQHARTVHAAACELAGLRAGLEAADDDALRARDGYLTAKLGWLDARERRIAGMAAVLAQELSPGSACPVCGSAEHPHPAKVSGDHVDSDAETATLDVLRVAEERLAAARDHVHAVQLRVAALDTGCHGLSVEQSTSQRESAAVALEEAIEAEARRNALTAQIHVLERAQHSLEQRYAGARTSIEVLRTRLEVRVEAAARQREQLVAVIGDATVADRVTELSARAADCDELAQSMHATARLVDARDERAQRFADAVRASDFVDAGDVRTARLSRSEISNAEALHRGYLEARAVAARTASAATLVEAARQPPPDIAGLRRALSQHRQAHQHAAGAARREVERLDRLDVLRGELDTALAQWWPLTAARDLAIDVASMCAGTSADNRTRTRLSHYVLSARLQQVVEAANVRLGKISGGRYQLQHSMQRCVGDARGGLGLIVLDTYTGETRDPVTLSGGETFYVSLALALGLADLVRDEIGGTELSTVFVDEGFSSLDPDTLDEVMDEIDALRSGGRSVGLVSHLSELRMRIPAKVLVVGSPRGSHIVAG